MQLEKQTNTIQNMMLSHTFRQLTDKPFFENLEAAVIRKNKIIQKSKNFSLHKSLSSYLQSKQHFFIDETESTLKGIYLLKLKKKQETYLIITTHNINNIAENVEDTLLVSIPILLLILLFLGSKLIDKILIPVKHITQTANEISINNFSGTIPVPSREDEIKALVEAFNNMIVRLKEGVDNLNRFNSDVSHELKTPLTVIKGEVEITLRKLRNSDEYIQSIQTIAYEAKQIEHIVENLLLLTRYTKENITQTFELCHLDAILFNTLEKYDTVIQNKQLHLHIDRVAPVITKANPLLLAAIFSNLIDNAIKYTTSGKKIRISLYQKEKIYFTIQDEGMGIPKEQLSKVTDRFYRGDISRSKHIQGFGLGLSIVKKGVELHYGEMKIISTLQKGTTVHIALTI